MTSRTHEHPGSVVADPKGERLLVTIPEAAVVLAIGRSTVYRLICTGQLTPIHIGRSVRLAVEELEAFVDGQLAINGDTERSH
jgi:excisionase family DNA binding protein